MPGPRILVTGAHGFFGPFVVHALAARGHQVLTTARRGGDAAIDLARPGSIAALLEALAPDFVVGLAALARMDACESNPALAALINAQVPAAFAERLGDRSHSGTNGLDLWNRSAGAYGGFDSLGTRSGNGIFSPLTNPNLINAFGCAYGGPFLNPDTDPAACNDQRFRPIRARR